MQRISTILIFRKAITNSQAKSALNMRNNKRQIDGRGNSTGNKHDTK